jgi:hypothetical protein
MTDEVRSRSVDRPPEAKESDISSQKTETPSREDKARARRKSTFIGLRKTKVLQKYFSKKK